VIAFGVLGVILLASLRSFRTALGALAPNLLPLAATYGFMGLAGIPLDAATVCVGCIALGIAVDDTIHIITGFGDRRAAGLEPEDALQDTFRRVLPPVVFTTVAIGAGFAVLGISQFTLVHNFGLVTTAMVVICLLADLTLLPAILITMERLRSRGKH
jgi:predicted RND superfamily exporter protein